MLETVSVEVFALGTGHGLDSISKEDGWIQVCLNGHTPDPTRRQRAEQVIYQGEPIVILWRSYGDGAKASRTTARRPRRSATQDAQDSSIG